jgi:hypothetical protein
MSFFLKDLNGTNNRLYINTGWDGDISLSMIGGKVFEHNFNDIRIGMGPNSGDPNSDVKDIQYIKRALRALAMEFQYQNGEITEEQIKKFRKETYKN